MVGPKDIWDALESAGASSVQAAGIMGNMIAESSLNVEMGKGGTQIDSNGYPVYGLVSWNAQDYPNAKDLVTGNPAADLKKQVQFLSSTGGFKAASGSTVSETASNFAANYERCQGCSAGGAQNTSRQANAATVASWASAGNWPAASGQASDTATLTAAQAQGGSQECAWEIGWGGIPGTSFLTRIFTLGQSSGNAGAGALCLFSKSQARALVGVGLLATGSLIIGWGTAMALAATGLELAAKIAAVTPGAGKAAAAASAVTVNRGNSPSGTTPPPAPAVQNQPPPPPQRTSAPMSSPSVPRKGGRTQQGQRRGP